MRILRPTLIGLTLGLSVVSLYLATVVAEERARGDDVAQQRREVTLRLERLTASKSAAAPAAEPAAAETIPAAPAPPPSTPAVVEEDDGEGGWSFGTSTERLRTMTNPALRAAIRTQERESERAAHPHLASELHLSSADADALFTILAEQKLRYEERYHRNQIAGRREYIDDSILDATTQRELTGLLGAEKFGALLQYRDGLPERRRIQTLNARLGKADAFSADEASQLAQLMRAERATFESELRQLPGNVRFRNGAPESARLRGVEGRAQQQFVERQALRTQSLHARIRERASSFLSPAQLQRLQQLQDERLARIQSEQIWAREIGPAEKAMQEAQEARQVK